MRTQGPAGLGADVVDLKDYIREIPDFPSPGILFRDITPLLKNPDAFKYVVDAFMKAFDPDSLDLIAPLGSRGFILGAPLASGMGKPLVPIRKSGKLPAQTYSVEYNLEYGASKMEVHADGINPGERVLLLDDVLATGGTLAAAARLVEVSGGVVAGIGLLAELTALNGRSQIPGYEVVSLIKY